MYTSVSVVVRSIPIVIIKTVVKKYTCDRQVHKCDSNIHHRNQDLIDVDYLKARMSSLLEAFPEPFFNHAMAVKVENIYYIFDPLISVCVISSPHLDFVNIFQMESTCKKDLSSV